jgi:hypothetical protein
MHLPARMVALVMTKVYVVHSDEPNGIFSIHSDLTKAKEEAAKSPYVEVIPFELDEICGYLS